MKEFNTAMAMHIVHCPKCEAEFRKGEKSVIATGKYLPPQTMDWCNTGREIVSKWFGAYDKTHSGGL